MLKTGSRLLTFWSGLTFLLAAGILTAVVAFDADSPILPLVFDAPEITALDPKVVASLNTLTILYNSCSVVVSVLVWTIIRRHLVHGDRWAYWLLVAVIGFIEVMAFVASAQVDHARWQVNVVLTLLYVAGSVITGYALLRHQPATPLPPDHHR
jgi:hypothetical protein